MEKKYKEILNNESERTWDVAETAESLLRYLGKEPITDTRYYWEEGRTHLREHASILISPRMLRPLIHSLIIALHNYPSQPIVKRYDTAFDSLTESFDEEQHRTEGDERERTESQ